MRSPPVRFRPAGRGLIGNTSRCWPRIAAGPWRRGRIRAPPYSVVMVPSAECRCEAPRRCCRCWDTSSGAGRRRRRLSGPARAAGRAAVAAAAPGARRRAPRPAGHRGSLDDLRRLTVAWKADAEPLTAITLAHLADEVRRIAQARAVAVTFQAAGDVGVRRRGHDAALAESLVTVAAAVSREAGGAVTAQAATESGTPRVAAALRRWAARRRRDAGAVRSLAARPGCAARHRGGGDQSTGGRLDDVRAGGVRVGVDVTLRPRRYTRTRRGVARTTGASPPCVRVDVSAPRSAVDRARSPAGRSARRAAWPRAAPHQTPDAATRLRWGTQPAPRLGALRCRRQRREVQRRADLHPHRCARQRRRDHRGRHFVPQRRLELPRRRNSSSGTRSMAVPTVAPVTHHGWPVAWPNASTVGCTWIVSTGGAGTSARPATSSRVCRTRSRSARARPRRPWAGASGRRRRARASRERPARAPAPASAVGSRRPAAARARRGSWSAAASR